GVHRSTPEMGSMQRWTGAHDGFHFGFAHRFVNSVTSLRSLVGGRLSACLRHGADRYAILWLLLFSDLIKLLGRVAGKGLLTRKGVGHVRCVEAKLDQTGRNGDSKRGILQGQSRAREIRPDLS